MSIVSDLLALGWTYGPDGVLRQPADLVSVSLAVHSDWLGDRYRIKTGRYESRRVYIRGADGQIVDSYWQEGWD